MELTEYINELNYFKSNVAMLLKKRGRYYVKSRINYFKMIKQDIKKPSTLQEFLLAKALISNTGFTYDEPFYQISIRHLQNFLNNESVHRFIFEACPRVGKTELVIDSLEYELCTKKDYNFLIVVGSHTKMTQLASKVKKFLHSDFAIKTYGSLVDKNLKDTEMYKELKNGNIIVFSTSKSDVPTGMGFHRIYFIDYLTAATYRSQSEREHSLSHIKGFITRKQHNPHTKLIFDNQRLGFGDLTEFILNNYNKSGLNYYYLQFPYKFSEEWSEEVKRKYKVNDYQYTFDKNQYLVSRFNELTEQEEKGDIGEEDFKIQFQGIVTGTKGEVIESVDFMEYSLDDLSNLHFQKICISIDTAVKTTKNADLSCISMYGISGSNFYLLDIKAGKYTPAEFKQHLILFLDKWKNGFNYGARGKDIDIVLMENTSSGSVWLESLKDRGDPFTVSMQEIFVENGLNLSGFNPIVNKYQRLSPFLSMIKEYKIRIPNKNVNIVEYSQVLAFKQECLEFSGNKKHKHDDRVDTMIASLEFFFNKHNRLKQVEFVENS